MPIHQVYKPKGWTPLDCIKALKRNNPSLIDVPMVYAGRLDPMAEGQLIILSGENRYSQKTYQNLDKTYEAQFLFGLSSDTYDALGIIKQGRAPNTEIIKKTLTKIKKTFTLPFPPYSAFKVKGKPLHWWVQQDRLDEITIPNKQMTVLAASTPIIKTVNIDTIRPTIINTIDLVNGNFRQTEIIKSWNAIKKQQLITANITLTVTAGTYIRALAESLGNKSKFGALLLNLNRTQVGDMIAENTARML